MGLDEPGWSWTIILYKNFYIYLLISYLKLDNMIFIDIFYTRVIFSKKKNMFALHSTVEFGIYQQSKSSDCLPKLLDKKTLKSPKLF